MDLLFQNSESVVVEDNGGGGGESFFSSFVTQKLDPYLPPSQKLDSEKANG